MGKSKALRKQPEKITILLFYMEGDESIGYIEEQIQVVKGLQVITYDNLIQYQPKLKELCNITWETDMFTVDFDNPNQEIKIDKDFSIRIDVLYQYLGKLPVMFRSRIQQIRKEFNQQIEQMRNQIQELHNIIDELKVIKQNTEFIRKNSFALPNMTGMLSQAQSFYERETNIDLDLAILFSEPLYNQEKDRPTLPAVDFRSQISRLRVSLQDSHKETIFFRCEIAKPESLRNTIRLSHPKILHIVCHGNQDGFLQFEDNSNHNLGMLKYVKPEDIKKFLKDSTSILPQLVFVNSCHSQKIGTAFYELGVRFVVMINSQDLISDDAAQMFSQNFYRNIFNGEIVLDAFNSARETVEVLHYSYGCCCAHSALEPHRENCRWTKVIMRRHPYPHKDYHVPSSKCKCPPNLKNFNRHYDDCQWARKVMFQINEDFRIPVQGSSEPRFPKRSQYPQYVDKQKRQFIICCCPKVGRKPHSQSYKFKYLIKQENIKDKLFQITHQIKSQVTDFTPTQLIEAHQKSKNIYGRQKQLYQCLKISRDHSLVLIYGKSGVGITSFSIKASTYAVERKMCQFFFFIDLYQIKDETVFRFKFNETTGLKNQSAVKNKKMIILLDNCDDFLHYSPQQFYQEIISLQKQIPKAKIIITIKQQSLQGWDDKKLFCCKFELPPFDLRYAIAFLSAKMKDKTDITVGLQQFRTLVSRYDILRVPKVIQSLTQTFTDSSKKITYEKLEQSIKQIANSDNNNLLENVLQRLKQRSIDAYQFLIFSSQFSDGISFQDLDIFSSYDKKQFPFKLPVKKNWRQHFSILFERNDDGNLNDKQQSDTASIDLKFQSYNSQTQGMLIVRDFQDQLPDDFIINMNKIKFSSEQQTNIKAQQSQNKIQSYYIQKAGSQRFLVKRFIRDFVWKRYKNQTTYRMKFIYVAYFSVVLQLLFHTLTQQKLAHEQLLTYSALSEAGIFSYSTSIESTYPKRSMTQSTQLAHDLLSDLQQIFMKNQNLIQKLKKGDPASFILNHKQDFLKIYDFKWLDVFEYLKNNGMQKEKKGQQIRAQQKIFLCFIENLMVYIPTALKLASRKTQDDITLLKYCLSRSNNQLDNLRKMSNQESSLKLHLKIYLLEIGISLQTLYLRSQQQNRKQVQSLQEKAKNTIFDYYKNLKDEEEYKSIQKMFEEQKKNFSLYMQQKYITGRESKIYEDIRNYIQSWRANKDLQPILMSKQALLIALIFQQFLQKQKTHIKVYKAKNLKFLNQILKMCSQASFSFKRTGCIKLWLKIQILSIEIYWHYNEKFSLNSIDQNMYKEIDDRRITLSQCEKQFLDPKNKLGGFTDLDDKITNLKKQIKSVLWKQAQSTIIFMKAYPLCSGQNPIIQNLIRKKNDFRRKMQKILSQKVNLQQASINDDVTLKHKESSKKFNKQLVNLDISTKFEILTLRKIQQQTETGCSIMVLGCNFRVIGVKLWMVVQGQCMKQQLIQVNEKFSKRFNRDNLFILILCGSNTKKAMEKIIHLNPYHPVIIALDSNSESNFEEFNILEQTDSDSIRDFLLVQNKNRQSQLEFVTRFIKKITRKNTQKDGAIILQKVFGQAKQKISNKNIDISMMFQPKQVPYIRYKRGCYRDLSPGYERNHNISNSYFESRIILRRWKKMTQLLSYLKQDKSQNYRIQVKSQTELSMSQNNDQLFSGSYDSMIGEPGKNVAYINIFGDSGSGKSYFIREIAKILVQRELYDYGVFLFDGKKIENSYNGNFERYIKEEAKISRMPVLQDFQRIMGQNMILIIDDFGIIKPRTDAKMSIFVNKIIEKKVNLILVSNNELRLDWLNPMKKIKLQKMEEFQIQLLAYNILDIHNRNQISQYLQMKKQRKDQVSVKQIKYIANRFKINYKDQPFLGGQSREMKKINSMAV